MNRIVLAVFVALCVLAGGVWWYFTTCCAPAPEPRPATVTVRNASPSAPVAAGERSGVERRVDEASPARDAARPRRKAPEPAAPVSTKTTGAATRSTATLRINSDVPGAHVFLNREFVGATPVTAKELTPGSYQLNVAAPGFDNHVETVQLDPGEREIIISFRRVRLDASIDVVHKHRFGSCKGRLIATPQGVRYETSDKDDAFAAALPDLEEFQVDYLNKNLRIQPRKGKRYDFTDPEGNADRLFVFHRDVEKARERLRGGG